MTASICSLFDAYVISLHQHFSSPKGFTSILTLASPDPSQCLMQCLVPYTQHASISYLAFCALTLYTERCQGIQSLHRLHPVALQEGSQELSLGNASSSLLFSSRMWSFEAPIVRSCYMRPSWQQLVQLKHSAKWCVPSPCSSKHNGGMQSTPTSKVCDPRQQLSSRCRGGGACFENRNSDHRQRRYP